MSAKTALPQTEKPQIERAEATNPDAEQQSAADRLLTRLSVRRRTQIAAGVETAVLDVGDGPPLVLLHGPGEFAGVWSPVLGDLVRSHRVVAPDLPGHGASASPADGLSGEWVDHWLDDLITAYCPEPPVLVGRVVGGAIGAAYAAAHPDRLSQLVLVDSLGLAPFDPDPRFGLAMLRFLASSVDRHLRTVHGLLRLRPRHGEGSARRSLDSLRGLRRRPCGEPGSPVRHREHDRPLRAADAACRTRRHPCADKLDLGTRGCRHSAVGRRTRLRTVRVATARHRPCRGRPGARPSGRVRQHPGRGARSRRRP